MHIKEITRKANAALPPLHPVARYNPRHILNQIYITHVRPIVDYADAIYHGQITVTDSVALENNQNRAAGLVTGAFDSYQKFAKPVRLEFITYQ